MKRKPKKTGPELKTLPVQSLKPAPYNPRSIAPDALAGLAASIRRWGLVEPIVVNRRGLRVIGGHQRLDVLKKEGVKTAICVVLDLPESEEKALNVSLNNPKIQGEFTDDLLKMIEDVKLELPELPAEELQLDALIADLDTAVGDLTEGEGGPGLPGIKSRFDILVTCESEERQTELLDRLAKEGWECRALIS